MTAAELKRALDALELSQTALAARLDISARTMRRYVAGAAAIPRVVHYAISFLHLEAMRVHLAAGGADRSAKRYSARDVEALIAMSLAVAKT